MAPVRTDIIVAATPGQAWGLVTDWTSHSRWIPRTTVTLDSDSPVSAGVGTRFTGRTSLGGGAASGAGTVGRFLGGLGKRVGFDDPMVVTQWQPPDERGNGCCRVLKRGPWLTGWAEVQVAATDGGTRVSWLEDVRTRWVPRFADPLVSAVGSVLFSRVLRKMAAELASSRPE